MRIFISLSLILLFNFTAARVKFGKVSKKELTATQSSLDDQAVAEILSKEGNYEISYDEYKNDFILLKKINVRIKVYDKDKTSDKYLNVKIPIYKVKNGEEEVSNIKAYTYNLENGSIQKTKVERSNIFTEKKNDYLVYEKFAFPNVKNGSILEYKYTIETTRFYDLDTWYFQEEIPVKYNRLSVIYPEYFAYNKDSRGEILERINSRKLNSLGNFDNILDEVVYKDVPALKKEPFVLNSNNLRASVRYELMSYNNPGIGYRNFSMDWAAIIKNLKSSFDYGEELKGNNFLDDDVQKFATIANKAEKLESIFEFVQAHYTWNKYYGLYPQKGPRKTYKEKTGNGTDINFILINMLKKANIVAHPVVISTVNNGILSVIPSQSKLNHTITAAYILDDLYLMDPTDKFSKVNMLPANDLNFQGFMMLDDGKYKEVNLENRLTSDNKTTLIYAIEDGIIKGKMNKTKSNYYAMNDIKAKIEDEDSFKKDFISDIDADILDFNSMQNADNTAILYRVDFEDTKSLEEIGNKLFLKPLLFLKEETNSFNFRNAERKYPLEFGTPFTEIKSVRLQIPEGYSVETLPEDKKVLIPNNVGGYNITYTIDGDFVKVQALVRIGYSLLPPSYYPSVKDMYQKIIEKENEQIVFKKL